MDRHLLFIAGSDIDYFYDVEDFLKAGDVCLAKPKGINIGGCVLNAASVCAMLGSDVKVLDYLKEDDEGSDLLIKGLNKNKVDTTNIVYGKDVNNGSCLIMCKDDEKCIFVIEPKRPFFVENEKMEELLINAKYIYTLMHTLKLSFKNNDLIRKAKSRGSKLIFDGASQYKEDYEKEMLLELADALFMNESSYQRFKDKCGFEPIDYMFNNGLEFACITNGDKGSTLYTRNGNYYEAAHKVNVVDSTGAGDSFAGCFLHFLDKGYELKECLKYASYAGSYACSKVGGMAAAIKEEELFKYIQSFN